MIKNILHLHELARTQQKKVLVLAAAHDDNALGAVVNAAKAEIVGNCILVGDKNKIYEISEKNNFDISKFDIINEPDNDKAALISVKLVHDGQAGILMKGILGTANLLRAVLNKECGLRSGELLSHLALFETEAYHKLVALSDAAMNIAPDFKSKVAIINNSVNYLRKIGIEKPKVAILAAVETVTSDMPITFEAAALTKMADRGQIKNCIIDGPLAFDNAISKESAEHKGLKSAVAGEADLLIGPDIEAANMIYKTIIFIAKAKCAAVIVGAQSPIVLTSRADSDETKLNSIALAAAVN